MTEISCQRCNFIFGTADEDIQEEGTYTFHCPECGRKQTLQVDGYVELVSEVQDELDRQEAEAYEQYCEMKADFKREEGY